MNTNSFRARLWHTLAHGPAGEVPELSPLTIEEQAELGQLRLAAAAGGPEPDYFPARNAYLEAAQGFKSELLEGEGYSLADLKVRQLINEITYAKTQLRRRRVHDYPDGYDKSDALAWAEHLSALKAEFDDRYSKRRFRSELDRLRLEVADVGVRDTLNEWPKPRPIEARELEAEATDVPDWDSVNVAALDHVDSGAEADDARDPLTDAQDTADQHARELEKAMFALHDEDNRPDVVWTEDGPEYYLADRDPKDIDKLHEAIDLAEKKLYTFLATNRGLIGGRPHWQSYFNYMDDEAAEAAEQEHLKETGDE